MCVVARGISAGEVVNALHGDAPYVFLGAAFVTVGLLAAALAALRRKPEALLIYFALFAAFYGVRLWIQSDLLKMTVRTALCPRCSDGLRPTMTT